MEATKETAETIANPVPNRVPNGPKIDKRKIMSQERLDQLAAMRSRLKEKQEVKKCNNAAKKATQKATAKTQGVTGQNSESANLNILPQQPKDEEDSWDTIKAEQDHLDKKPTRCRTRTNNKPQFSGTQSNADDLTLEYIKVGREVLKQQKWEQRQQAILNCVREMINSEYDGTDQQSIRTQ